MPTQHLPPGFTDRPQVHLFARIGYRILDEAGLPDAVLCVGTWASQREDPQPSEVHLIIVSSRAFSAMIDRGLPVARELEAALVALITPGVRFVGVVRHAHAVASSAHALVRPERQFRDQAGATPS